MVSVEVPAPVTVAGLKLPVTQVSPLHVALMAVRATAELKPPATKTFTVVVAVVVGPVPVPIAPTLSGLGEAISSNEGVGSGAAGWKTQTSLRSTSLNPVPLECSLVRQTARGFRRCQPSWRRRIFRKVGWQP